MDESTLCGGEDFSVKKKKRSLGRQCAAFGCYNTFYNTDGYPSGLHFFRFPQKNPEKTRWCNLIKRVDGMDGFKVTDSTVLCEKHFTEADIKRNPGHWRLVRGAAPSVNLVSSSVSTERPKSRKPPTSRSLKTMVKSVGAEPTDAFDVSTAPEFSFSGVTVSTQTDFSFIKAATYLPFDSCDNQNDIMKIFIEAENLKLEASALTLKIDALNCELDQLKLKLTQMQSNVFSIEKLKADDSATKFYTGFPNYSSLMATFEYFEPKVNRMHYWGYKECRETSDAILRDKSSRGRKRTLSHLDEFVLVLIRLKLGLFVSDLADRFRISPATVSKIFTTWICFLFNELPSLFPFPSKELVLKNMPSQFKAFPNTRIILDCTELFTEVPSSMKSQSQTWSEYKHHNTWKVLIGISPSGCITFVSKLWSGKVSDKEITLKSGILSLLEDGDNIMADRGFDIEDILPPGVTLNIPPFKGTRDQLTAMEAEATACIASVRVHVERAIGRVKNYHILDGVLPLSLYPIANQIFSVCCMLTNFLPILVVSKEK